MLMGGVYRSCTDPNRRTRRPLLGQDRRPRASPKPWPRTLSGAHAGQPTSQPQRGGQKSATLPHGDVIQQTEGRSHTRSAAHSGTTRHGGSCCRRPCGRRPDTGRSRSAVKKPSGFPVGTTGDGRRRGFWGSDAGRLTLCPCPRLPTLDLGLVLQVRHTSLQNFAHTCSQTGPCRNGPSLDAVRGKGLTPIWLGHLL